MTTMKYKIYIIVFSEVDFDNEDFITFINNTKEIIFWFTFIRNMVIVKTELNSKELYSLIKKTYAGKKMLISKIDTKDVSGFLPKKYIEHLK